MSDEAEKMIHRGDWCRIPNILSILRILVIPVFVVLFFSGGAYLYGALTVLIVSGLTDLLDGWIARHFHMITNLGKFLDPLADKLTQGTVGVCMMIAYCDHPSIVALFAIFFLKELLMGIGGLVLHAKKIAVLPGAKWFGKLATVAFYVSICAVVFCKAVLRYEELWVIWIFVGITAILMVNAFVRYLLMFRQICRNTYDFAGETPAGEPK